MFGASQLYTMSIYLKPCVGFVLLLMLPGCASPPELASVSALSVQGDTLFRDVSVFDGVNRKVHQDVLVAGEEVVVVTDTGELEAPLETVVLAGAGLTLLPGLIDSHAHLISAGEKHPPAPDPVAIGETFLYAGVTTILVTTGLDEVTSFRHQQREGLALGPIVFWGGPGLSAPGGHPIPLLRAMLPWPVSWLVTRRLPTAADGTEARERVGEIVAEHQPDFVKIVYDDLPPGSSHLSRDALRGAVAAAKAHGVRPIVHATTPDDTIDAGRRRRSTPRPCSATRCVVRRRHPANRGGRSTACDHRPTAIGQLRAGGGRADRPRNGDVRSGTAAAMARQP